MYHFNGTQKHLKEIILKPDHFEEAIQLTLLQHAMVHSQVVSEIGEETIFDRLWKNLDEHTFKTVKEGHKSVAYHIWHTTRIEDITMNLLVAGDHQIFNEEWKKRVSSSIIDTGNAMNEIDIADFSKTIIMDELKNYRISVGKKTREVLLNLTPGDMKRKMEKGRLNRVIDEGAVCDVDSARWLIDFWYKKNVAGIILMPITRHHLVHLNESLRIKK